MIFYGEVLQKMEKEELIKYIDFLEMQLETSINMIEMMQSLMDSQQEVSMYRIAVEKQKAKAENIDRKTTNFIKLMKNRHKDELNIMDLNKED